MLYKELLGGDDDYKEKGSKSMPKSYIAIFRNSYLILWNRAASIERDTSQNSNPLDSLFLRLEALKYSYWVVTDFVKFFDQANKAIRVYCQKIKNTHCITLDTVCEELFLLMGQLLDDSVYTDSITNYLEVFKGSFSFLLSWVSHLLNMDMVTKAEEVTEKFKLKICKFLMTKLACNSSVMEYCVDILLLAVYFHPCVLSEGCSEKNSRRTIVLDHCCSFRQPILDMSDCLSRCFTVLLEQFIRLSSWVMIENNDLMELHLFIPNLSKLLENFITAEIFRSKEKSARAQSSHEHKFYNYCSFYTHLLAISTASLGRYSKLGNICILGFYNAQLSQRCL